MDFSRLPPQNFHTSSQTHITDFFVNCNVQGSYVTPFTEIRGGVILKLLFKLKKQSIVQLWKIPFTFLSTGILGFSHRVPILVTVLPLQMAKSSVVWNPVIYVLMNKQVFSILDHPSRTCFLVCFLTQAYFAANLTLVIIPN